MRLLWSKEKNIHLIRWAFLIAQLFPCGGVTLEIKNPPSSARLIHGTHLRWRWVVELRWMFHFLNKGFTLEVKKKNGLQKLLLQKMPNPVSFWQFLGFKGSSVHGTLETYFVQCRHKGQVISVCTSLSK